MVFSTRRAFGLAASLVVTATGLGCSEPDASADVSVRDAPSGLRVITIHRPPSEVDRWQLGEIPLLTITGTDIPETPYFGSVGDVVWLTNGRIAVNDTQARQIHLFGPDGHFSRSFGGPGDGPEEFRRVTSLSHLGDSVFAYDARHDRISVWHTDGGLIRTVELAERQTGLLTQGAWVLSPSRIVSYGFTVPREVIQDGPAPYRVQGIAHVTLHDRSGQVLEGADPFDGPYSSSSAGDLGLPFSPRPAVTGDGQRIAYGSGSTSTIQLRDTDFNSMAVVTWPSRDRALDATEVEGTAEAAREIFDQAPPDRIDMIVEAWTAEHLLPEIRPAFARLLYDDEGRLWISGFEPRLIRRDYSSRQWEVVGRDGRPLGSLGLAPNQRLAAVRGDRVLVIERDELGVETLAAYTIERST